MNMKNKNAKFFCESCGSEVPGNSKFCPTCGRFFASVRCPVCGETGSNDKFKNGCPNCGYSVSGAKNRKIKGKNNKRLSRRARRKLAAAIDAKNGRIDGSLPTWSYFLIFSVLALFIAGVYFYLKTAR